MHTGGARDGARVSLCHSKAQEGKLYERSSDVTVDPLHRRERNKTQRHNHLGEIQESLPISENTKHLAFGMILILPASSKQCIPKREDHSLTDTLHTPIQRRLIAEWMS